MFLALSLAVARTDLAAAPLPQPLPGWRIELVAEAPQLKHPTVVAAAPDGRVFVAEDPMDISLPKADVTEGRILCRHPDGRTTVFAEKLHAVFGLQYLEGKLFVLHNPQFSVFDDAEGVGRNRRELIERTLAEPWALEWNDHVPANFRLAMDGYFYVASGDKGLHNARGTDGSRADLFTGGIFRIRPDGSQLEVVGHGVRNILDVALNSEDEQFTYDNTDEHEWMGRFTHMVEAGYYGYPHDFSPRRPHTLWMMEDYGAGAACGVLAYTEDALPPEYHGNVFLSDFGKRQIMRVRVERDGATYRAVAKEDLFPNPPGDFRPVGITLGADGKSIYICDWQHRDEKAQVSVGRLLRLIWTGPDPSVPKPAWYLPAATGKAFEAGNRDLIQALAHPSRDVRLTAQRQLTRRKATAELTAVLVSSTASALTRSHALWGLDAIDHGRSARAGITAATADPDPILRRQAARQLGIHRDPGNAPVLRILLQDRDPSVRFQAATSLGRTGEAAAVAPLLTALSEPDPFARYAVFTALNRIGTNSPATWPVIVRGLESPVERVREGTRFALRETYDDTLLHALVNLYNDPTKAPAARREALALVAALHHQPAPWDGQWWAYHPALQPPPPKNTSWSGTATVLTTLRTGLREQDSGLRRTCIDGLAAARDTVSAPALRDLFPRETDTTSRTTLLHALGAMKDADTLPLIASELEHPSAPDTTRAAITAAEEIGGESAARILTKFLQSPRAETDLLPSALAALGKLKAPAALPVIEPLTHHDTAAVRSAAFSSLGRLQGILALPALEAGLNDPALEVRRTLVKALGDLKSTNAVPALLKAYADPDTRADAFPALTRMPDERSIEALLDGISSKNPTERNSAHLAIRTINLRVLKSVEARANSLSPQALTELRHIYAGNPAAEAGPLFAKELKLHSPEEYLDVALKPTGDPQRGQKLFTASGGLNCTSCHRVAGQGSDLGPDLSGVGTQFDRRALAEAILYPSKTVREGYQQILIEMNDGEEYAGVVKGETTDTLLLRDSSAREHKLPRAGIKSRTSSTLSLMPEGLQAALSLDEFADLIAYLESLKGKPEPGK